MRTQAQQTGPTVGDRSVRLGIATNSSTYRAGDSVRVRLQFVNDAQAPITYVMFPPWGEVRLVVTDSVGRVVAPIKSPADIYLVSSRKVTIPAGGTQVATWSNQEWFSLRQWGYELPPPGRYTIAGAPQLTIPGVRPDTTLRSNRVTITITP